ncbi:MAG TPA: hypothetical protein VNV41_07700 [Candidatus Acidoferrales bacterium]|jgi:hypothetical protein|nr:hypothetical protein [Candidatus Acidoferrales bacterium]
MAHRAIYLGLSCTFALAISLGPSVAGSPQEPSATATSAPASAPSSPSDSEELRFTGEVMHEQPFTRDVGHNLTFRLTPATADEGGGWVIEMLPPVEPSDDPIEFSAIATPPYHSYNDRYLAAAFGYSAKEAVEFTTRKFNFVQSVTDEHRADEVVNAALYPSTVGDSEKARIAAEAAALKLGTGQLHIVHSRVTQGKAGSPDTIAWVKFEVVLSFSSGLTLQQVLAPHPPVPKR